MRISDWSSDVCSSDLEARGQDYVAVEGPYAIAEGDVRIHMVRAEGSGHRIREHRCLGAELGARDWPHGMGTEIGRESCRERVGQSVSIAVVATSLTTKTVTTKNHTQLHKSTLH